MFAETAPVPEFSIFWQVLALFFSVIIGGLMITYYVKAIFFSHQVDEEKEPVKRTDFKNTILEINAKIESSRLERVTQMLELDKRIIALSDYTHDNVHDLRGVIQTNYNKVAIVDQKVDLVVSDWLKKLESRLDRVDSGLANLGSKVSELMGRIKRNEEYLKEDKEEKCN